MVSHVVLLFILYPVPCLFVEYARGQSDCVPPALTPAGDIEVMADKHFEINCTEGSCSNLPVVLSGVDVDQTPISFGMEYADKSSKNQSCTYHFNVSVSQNTDLNCYVRHDDVICISNETTSISVLPPRPHIIESDTSYSQQLYFCKASCKYFPLEWYIGMTTRTVNGIIDEDFVNSRFFSKSDCINGFQNLTLTVNVSTRDFTDILPTLTCGGRLKSENHNHIIYSDLITRVITTTTTTITTSPSQTMDPTSGK